MELLAFNTSLYKILVFIHVFAAIVWLWIALSLAGIVATALTGSLFLGPQGGRIVALADEKGLDDPAVAAARDRLVLVARIDYMVLVAVVGLMVFKPGV